VKDLAVQLLDAKLYDFVGTDTHNVGHLERLKTLTLTNKKAISIGNNFLNKTFLG
jgi:tyrosine-protein phosphatase YwqE